LSSRSISGWIWKLAIVLACGGSVEAQPARIDDLPEERAKTRVHVTDLRIQPTFFAEPGACLEFGEADLKVVLRGERIVSDRFELDRERKPTLHVLLIDTSESMSNALDGVRNAASEYVRQLRPQDERAMVVTFDDSVLLHQPPTGDREKLLRAIDGIRPGTFTSMYDGLHSVLQEAATHRERPIVILLTDGVDSSSFHLREDVWGQVGHRTDLTIFTIGFDLPPLGGMNSPSGVLSTRRFLQRLAVRTNGKYFAAPTRGRLHKVYRRIREMLDNEAVLYVVEPDPEAEPGKLKVTSERPGCRIKLFKERDAVEDPLGQPIRGPYPGIPHGFALPPDPRYLKTAINRAYHSADPECAPTEQVPVGIVEMSLRDLWRAEVTPDGIDGCVLDVTMDRGTLYDPYSMSVPQNWWSSNAALKVKSRRFDIRVPAIEELPGDPAEWMDEFAEFALSVEHDDIERDSRKRPYWEHARPYHDWPRLTQGRTFFDLRSRIAGALFLREDYREWVLGRLREEAQGDLERLERRFRRLAPGSPEETVELAVLQSEQGRRILARADAPSARDLTRFLSAWLGDLSAHELFVRWEAAIVDQFLRGKRDWRDAESLWKRWRALRQVFFAPSYTRTLTLLSPVHDRERERIGFYRVVLPRTSWYLKRLKNYKRHPGWSNLPLDLVPDVPMAHWAVERVFEASPDLAAHLREHGYRVASLDYKPLSKPGKQTPVRAFHETRVVLLLRSSNPSSDGDTGPRLVVEVDLQLEGKRMTHLRIISLRMIADKDAGLAALALDVENEINGSSVRLPK
jgi:hypothetical protein